MTRFLFFYKVLLFLTFLLVLMIIFGSLLRHHYHDGKRFLYLQKVAVFLAEVPTNARFIISNLTTTGDIIEPISAEVFNNKKFFEKKIESTPLRDELLLTSRHDGDIGRSIVEIRDINTFEVLHHYLPDIKNIYKNIDLTKFEFMSLKKNIGINRFRMNHPTITSNGELIFAGESPLVKVDFNSNIVWVNDEDIYHHSINLDLDENIYSSVYKYPYSNTILKYIGIKNDAEDYDKDIYTDDAINILDQNGKIIFTKSIGEILVENNLAHRIFSQSGYMKDPTHLNDVQPVLSDGPFFKKGDLFLSLRNLSIILLYRPKTNKVIRVIEGDFFNQHDVDILDEKTISIYNNNVFLPYNNTRLVENNELIIYDFEKNKFSKKYEEIFKKLEINSDTSGLADFLPDGSVVVEDQNNGRIFFINNLGEVVWEFNNLNSNKRLYDIWWARVIDINKSNQIRSLIKNKNND